MLWYLKGFLPCPVHPAPLSQSCVCPRCAAAHPPGITSAPFHALGLLTYILVVKGEWISLSHGMGQDLPTLGMHLSSFSAQKHLCVECKVPLHFNVSHFKRQFTSITSNTVRQWCCHPPVMPEWGRRQREHCVHEQGTAAGPPTWQPLLLFDSISSFLTGNKTLEVHLKSVYF